MPPQDPKYLPGLEGDPQGAILENWGDADWREWFRDEVMASQSWQPPKWRLNPLDDPTRIYEPMAGPARGDEELLSALKHLDPFLFGPGRHESGARAKEGWDFAFGTLSLGVKKQIFYGWYRVHHGLDLDPSHAEPGGSETGLEPGDESGYLEGDEAGEPSADQVHPTLLIPDWYIEQRIEEELAREAEAREEGERLASLGGLLRSWWMWVILIVLTAGIIGLVVLNGDSSPPVETGQPEGGSVSGGGEPETVTESGDQPPEEITSAVTEFTVDDPVGDGVDPTPFERNPEPDPRGDIIALAVNVDGAGNRTVITVEFQGAAQELGSLGADARITPASGDIINMLMRPDGSAKVSNPPAGESLEASWSDPSTLVWTLSNWTPQEDATLAFMVLVDEGGLHFKDVVELDLASPSP